jgi:hypothetical protein
MRLPTHAKRWNLCGSSYVRLNTWKRCDGMQYSCENKNDMLQWNYSRSTGGDCSRMKASSTWKEMDEVRWESPLLALIVGEVRVYVSRLCTNKGCIGSFRYLYCAHLPCLLVNSWPSKTQWLLYVPQRITLSNSTFCPHSVLMCFVWIWEHFHVQH